MNSSPHQPPTPWGFKNRTGRVYRYEDKMRQRRAPFLLPRYSWTHHHPSNDENSSVNRNPDPFIFWKYVEGKEGKTKNKTSPGHYYEEVVDQMMVISNRLELTMHFKEQIHKQLPIVSTHDVIDRDTVIVSELCHERRLWYGEHETNRVEHINRRRQRKGGNHSRTMIGIVHSSFSVIRRQTNSKSLSAI